MKTNGVMKRGIAHLLSVLLIMSTVLTGLTALGVVQPEEVFAADISELAVGDTVYMGKATNGYTGGLAQNIVWKVIDKDSDGNPLLVSQYLWKGDGTDDSVWVQFNEERTNQWSGSNAETWCNNFYSNNLSGFPAAILNGKVFFLSTDEANKLADKKAYFSDDAQTAVGWWLRTGDAIGSLPAIQYIKDDGTVQKALATATYAARPALYLDASADICAYKGTYWTISAAHNYGNLIPQVDPTATEEGVKAHYHCDQCGKDFDENKKPVTAEDLKIDKITQTKPGHVIIDRDDDSYDEENPEFQPAAGGKYVWLAQDGTFASPLYGAVEASDFKLQTKTEDTDWTDAEVGTITIEGVDDYYVRIIASIPDNTDTFDKYWRAAYKHSDVGTQYESCSSVQLVQVAKTDKTALDTAIKAAQAAQEGVEISTDGTDVDTSKKWTTQAEKDTFDAAIAAAQGVYEDATVSQTNIDKAVTDLNTSKETYEAAKKDGTKASKPGHVIIDRDDDSYDEENPEFQPAAGGKYVWLAQDGTFASPLYGAVEASDFKLQTKTEDTDWTDAEVGTITIEGVDDYYVRIIASIPDNTDTFDKYWRAAYKHSDVGTQYESCSSVQLVQVAKTDKTALDTAIKAAQAAQEGVKVSEDGSDVDVSEKYVTTAEKKALDDAIAAAQAVYANATVSQIRIDEAVINLNTAKETYEAAKKDGTKSSEVEKPAIIISIDSGNEQPAAGGTYRWAFLGEDDSADFSGVTSSDFKAQVKAGDGEWADSDAVVTLSESDDYNGIVTITVPDNDEAVAKQWRFKYAGEIIDWSYNEADCPAITQAAKEEQTEPVDKSALETALTEANAATAGVKVSTDGSDVDPSEKWTTQADKDTFDAAIEAAQTVKDNETATQADVDSAVTTLNTAKATYEAAKKDGTKTAETEKPVIADIYITSANEQPAKEGTYTWAFYGIDDSVDWSGVTSADFTAQVKVGEGEWADSSAAVTLNESDEYDGIVSIAVPDNDEAVVKQWRFKYAGGIVDYYDDPIDCLPITQAAAEAAVPEKPQLYDVSIDTIESGSGESQPASGGVYAWYVLAAKGADFEETGVNSDDFIIQSKIPDGDWETNSSASATFEIGTNYDEGLVTATIPDNENDYAIEWRFFYEPGGKECPVITQAAKAADPVDPAVDAVASAINELPAPDAVTAADKEKIEAARAKYDALTQAQKEAFNADTLKKLTDAEAALKAIEDEAAAQSVKDKIDALPAADKTSTADKEKIEEARKAYDALSEDQKKKIDADTLAKLTNSEKALEEAQKAEDAKAAADKAAAEKAAAEAKAKATTSVTINSKTVNAASIKAAIAAAGGRPEYVKELVIGKGVKKLSKKAFKGTKATTLVVKSKKLSKKSVKGSLKGSKVKTVKVKIGSKKVNKKYVKRYKKIFTKKNAGKKVKVK